MQHIIKKQSIDIRLNGRMDSFRIQQKLSDQYWKFFVPLLEEEFDKIATEDEVICLETIEIDMGMIKESDIDKFISDPNIVSSIKRQIHDYIARELSIGKTAVSRSASANSFNQWLFYMRNGYLSWNVSSVTDQWYTHVLEELATDYQNVFLLKKAVKDDDIILRRLIRQHPEEFLVSVVEILAAQQQVQLRIKLAELHNALKPILPDHDRAASMVYESFWQQVFMVSLLNEGEGITRDLGDLMGSLDAKTLLPEGSKIEMNAKSEMTVENTDEAASHLYLQNAGLVLIHPFLNLLFKHLGLIDGKEFINIDAREKAIYLLFYAATGKTEAKEYELVVPKMLCGYAIALPIRTDIIVSDLETTEVDNMLQAAISNWDLLKNTSPDGLREGFLQRSGRVLISSEKINIQVEQSGIDMLLDHLPWNLSLIKLPWLNQIIQVEWR